MPSERIRRLPPISLNQDQAAQFRESSLRYQNGLEFEIPETFLACIHDAQIYSNDFLVLNKDHQIVFESALSRDEVLEENGILDRLRRPCPRHVKGDYCMLSTPWSDGYYHWLMDALPRLSLLERFPELQTTSLIVQKDLRGYQKQTLELLRIPSGRITPFDNTCWQVDRLYYPELLGPTGNPSPQAVAWLRERFMSKAALEPGRGRRRLYLTRRDAGQRRIVNEKEIVQSLAGLGFEVVCPGDLSFAEQVELFSDVSIVVAAHGAGCTNMVFAPTTATLVELFGDNYINGCFWALANILGQRYAFLTGPRVDRLDYTISAAQLATLLKVLLDRPQADE